MKEVQEFELIGENLFNSSNAVPRFGSYENGAVVIFTGKNTKRIFRKSVDLSYFEDRQTIILSNNIDGWVLHCKDYLALEVLFVDTVSPFGGHGVPKKIGVLLLARNEHLQIQKIKIYFCGQKFVDRPYWNYLTRIYDESADILC